MIVFSRLVLFFIVFTALAQEPSTNSNLRTTPVQPAVVPELQIDLANDYYARKLYPLAVAEYKKFIALFPADPEAVEIHYRLGECYRELKQKELARQQFALVSKKYPNTDFEKRSIYRLGEAAFQEKNYSKTVEILNPLLSQKTLPAIRNGAAFYIGQALTEQKKWVEAEKILGPVARNEDLGELAPYLRELTGRVYRAQAKSKEALAIWEEALKQKAPQSVETDLLMQTGAVKLELGDERGALEIFTLLQGRRLPQGYVISATLGLLRSAYKVGEYKLITDRGQTLYDRLSNPYRSEAAYLIADSWKKINQYQKALLWFEKSLKDNPGSAYAENAAYQIVLCAGTLGNEKNLQACGNNFLKAFPASEFADEVHSILAESFFKTKQYLEALSHYEFLSTKALLQDVKRDAAYKKAWCLQLLNEKEKAQKAFLEFAEAYPKDAHGADALYLAAGLAMEQEKWDEAVKTYSLLIERYPGNRFEQAWFEMAMAQGRLKNDAGMEKSLKIFLEKYPKHELRYEANYWLGWLAIQKRNWEQALRYLDVAVKNTETTFYVEARLQRAVVYYHLRKLEETFKEVGFIAGRKRLKEVPLEVIRWVAQNQLNQFHGPQAIDAYRWYVETAGNRSQVAEAQMGLGQAYSGVRKWNEAIGSFKQVISEEGNSDLGIKARLGAVRALIELGTDFKTAQGYLDEVLTERPEGLLNARARLLEGDILVAQKKNREAAAKYYSVAVLFDDPELSPWALKLAAEAFERAGNFDEARHARAELTGRYPEAVMKGNKAKP